MSSPKLRFASRALHRAHLAAQATLPAGFRVGTTRLDFTPFEVPRPARMTLTLLALERPTDAFASAFTCNAFPGAPVLVGRRRLAEPALRAIVVNNKIANACAPGGEEAAEQVCARVGALLGAPGREVLPCSTGVIGWRLPVDAMLAALPAAAQALQGESALPAAEGIVTTDLYPKVRAASIGGGRLVGIAKGAGMIEPNLATMLVFLLTDLDVPRDVLREDLAEVVGSTFNRISIDSDTSTSDTVVLVSSRRTPCPDRAAFRAALEGVCADLAGDVVRNGEGVHHVMRIAVRGAPDGPTALGVGKAVANSPLFQCAVAGNDPNVGRLVAAIGKYLGAARPGLDLGRARLRMGGVDVLAAGGFRLTPATEAALVAHMKAAELYASVPPADGLTFRPSVDYPPHEECVEIDIDLGLGRGEATVLGADRTHEYVSENADYRS